MQCIALHSSANKATIEKMFKIIQNVTELSNLQSSKVITHPCSSMVKKLKDSFEIKQNQIILSFDLDEGFGNFLNCTEEKRPLRLNRH